MANGYNVPTGGFGTAGFAGAMQGGVGGVGGLSDIIQQFAGQYAAQPTEEEMRAAVDAEKSMRIVEKWWNKVAGMTSEQRLRALKAEPNFYGKPAATQFAEYLAATAPRYTEPTEAERARRNIALMQSIGAKPEAEIRKEITPPPMPTGAEMMKGETDWERFYREGRTLPGWGYTTKGEFAQIPFEPELGKRGYAMILPYLRQTGGNILAAAKLMEAEKKGVTWDTLLKPEKAKEEREFASRIGEVAKYRGIPSTDVRDRTMVNYVLYGEKGVTRDEFGEVPVPAAIQEVAEGKSYIRAPEMEKKKILLTLLATRFIAPQDIAYIWDRFEEMTPLEFGRKLVADPKEIQKFIDDFFVANPDASEEEAMNAVKEKFGI